MALQGSLKDISPSDLIQLNCQPGAQARLRLSQGDQTIEIYFDEGEIVHAQSGAEQGEEVVYRMLAWEDATFEVERDVVAPARSVTTPWAALMMEGLRRADEARQSQVSAPPAPSTSNPLKTALSEMAARSSFFGLAVISRDGVLLADELQSQADRFHGADASRVGALAAGLINLSVRSIDQLDCGELMQTLIQSNSGNIILSQTGPKAVLIALADRSVNLGMAFLETREGAQIIAELVD